MREIMHRALGVLHSCSVDYLRIVMPSPVHHEIHGEFLDAVIEGAIDCIIIIDVRGTVMRFNEAAVKLFGYAADEVIGENVRKLMPEPHHSAHDGYLSKYMTTKVPGIIGVGREVEAVKKDGTRIPVRLAVSEVVIKGEHYFTGVLHDLTNIKQREKEILLLTQELERKVKERTDELQVAINKLLQINKKLEHEIHERRSAEVALRKSQQDLQELLEKEKELSDLKSRFVSTASHEFRTPLSSILSSAALVGRYTDADQQPQREKHVDRIKASVKTLTTILDDFLSLSKLEHGEVNLKPEDVVFAKFLQNVSEEMDGMIKPGQHIVIRNEAGDMILHTDRTILKIVLYNLLSNAIKYSGPGEILCHARKENKKLVIDIVDQGMGIPVADQRHLFERFFRAYNATNIQGTGLGLYIVHNYVRLLDGAITFESEEGKGSVFTIKLPL